MARIPRTYRLIENGYYHIHNRGNNKKPIFKEIEDFLIWKQYLADYKKKYKAKIIAYVLMPNHYHLIIKCSNLPKIIGVFNSRYAMYFNNKYELSGHLFQDRYKSRLILDEPYMITLIRYIHNNPVRAELAEEALDYEQSSLRDIKNNNNSLVDIKIIDSLIERSMGTPLELILS